MKILIIFHIYKVMNVYLEKLHFCMLRNSTMYYGLNCKPKPQKRHFLLKKSLLRNLVVIPVVMPPQVLFVLHFILFLSFLSTLYFTYQLLCNFCMQLNACRKRYSTTTVYFNVYFYYYANSIFYTLITL